MRRMPNATLNHRKNFERTKLTILSLVRMQPGITRVEIAHRLGLSTASITQITDELAAQGYIVEQGLNQIQPRGRKAIRLEIAKKNHFFVSIDIGGEHIRVAVMDLSADILSLERCKTRLHPLPDQQLEAVHAMARAACDKAGVRWDQIEAVSCGISGLVNPYEGMVYSCPNIAGWQNVPLQGRLEALFGKPCFIEDSTPLKALAEKYYGQGRGVENFIHLNMGVGISMSMFFNGSLYRGARGSAGEIGHVPVANNTRRCKCGNVGCLETLVSAPRIIDSVQEALRLDVQSSLQAVLRENREAITIETLARAGAEGDWFAMKVIREIGRNVGQALAWVAMCLNPELVVLGGPVAKLGQAFKEAVEEQIDQQSFPQLTGRVRIEISNQNDDQATLIGGMILISENYWRPGDAVRKAE